MKTTEEKLKPCPLCGGDSVYEETVAEHAVWCKRCGYSHKVSRFKVKTKKQYKELKRKLIDDYNRMMLF